MRKEGHSKLFMTFSLEKLPLIGGEEIDESMLNREVFMHPLEVEKQLAKLYASEDQRLVRFLYNVDAEAFFIRTVVVPPSRFRPPRVLDDMVTMHAQTALLLKIVATND